MRKGVQGRPGDGQAVRLARVPPCANLVCGSAPLRTDPQSVWSGRGARASDSTCAWTMANPRQRVPGRDDA
jgi:hypothetical protein